MLPTPSPRAGHEALAGPAGDALLAHALAAANNGIVVADAHGDMPITYVNDGFTRMTGYHLDEVVGRNCRFLQGPAPDPATTAAFRQALASEGHGTFLVRNYRVDGSPFWNEVEISPVVVDGAVTHYIGVQNDVTARVEAEGRARFLAQRDPLTGLANRRGLQQRLDHAVRRANRHGHGTALLFLDVDDFKRVNDMHGHAVGDELLRQIAARLELVVRPGDLLARTGGDEFALVISTTEDPERVGLEAADRVLRAVEGAFAIEGEALGTSVSIGVSSHPGDAATPAELLQHADAAMYEVKRAGGAGRRSLGSRRAPRVPGVVPEVQVMPTDAGRELDAILHAGAITSAYQPLVELDGHRVVGYEALARGPQGSSLARPDLLFATAAAAGRTHELEWACRTAALQGARGGLPDGATLFVNVEPSSLSREEPAELRALMVEAVSRQPIVLELTERALTDSPSAVLDAVPRLRDLGFSIALDDVGADVRSVALMPFLRPDVIKLDLRLVQDRPTPALAAIAHAVNAEAERSGAIVLAEGIEDAVQQETARALGARFGQGWLYGRPGPLPEAGASGARAGGAWAVPRAPQAEEGHTPFEVVREHSPVRTGTKGLLLSMSKHLEAQVVARSGSSVLLATFQEARHFTPATQARYRRLAQSAAFVGALGVNMGLEPAPGVRGADLSHTEKLRGEWDVVVVDPHFAGAFVAQDLGDVDRPDMERRFAFSVTYDRDLVVEAARVLMRRIRPLPG